MNDNKKMYMSCSHCHYSHATVESYIELEWLGWRRRDNGDWWCPHCVNEEKK